MKKNIRFYLEQPYAWYADIPEWTGDKEDLEMVAGADNMLDMISQGDSSVILSLSTAPVEGFNELKFVNLCGNNGADYVLESYNGIKFNLYIWLCNVLKFVFGEFPEVIYFKRIL